MKLNVSSKTRRPRRLSATERIRERAEERALRRAARRDLAETGPDDWIAWEQVKRSLER